MSDPKAAPSARTSAASAILDRGWGRPEQAVATETKKEPRLVEMLKELQARPVEDEEDGEEEQEPACSS